MNTLESLFKPKSVAIVGVSKDANKLGNVVFKNLVNAGYKGNIYPVNPKYQEVEGLKCYNSIESIPEELDVACLVVPKDFVKDIVISSVKKNVKFLIIITAGFGEMGEEGKKLENEIYEIIKGTNTRILGPNCLGLISTVNNTNVSFAASYPGSGNIAFFSQSGALCTAVLDKAASQDLGFSSFVSMGNNLDINENDLLNYFLHEEHTTVISAYLEEIDDDINMLKSYSASNSSKPFIVFKPGRSKQAQSAMLSHTGSIADNEVVFQTAMKQYGIMAVSSIELLYNLMRAFSWGKEIYGNRVAIVTNAGGPGIIATDAIVDNKLKIATLKNETMEALKAVLPPSSNIHNPVDLLGDASSERYQKALDILIKDENVDVIMVILTPQFVTEIDQTTELILKISKQTDKTIVPVYLGEKKLVQSKEVFFKSKIPLYKEIDEACEVIKYMSSYYSFKRTKHLNLHSQLDINKRGKYANDIEMIISDKPTALPDNLIQKLVDEVGIVPPPQTFAKNIEDAIEFAKDKYPVVLKAPNSLITHKTDIKALYTNLKNEQEITEAFNQILALVKNLNFEYLLVQKQMKPKQELMLGVKRDGNSEVYNKGGGFGHLLLFGQGGIYSEVFNDFAFGLVPLSDDEIVKMISKTKVSNILLGVRGQKNLAVNKLFDTIKKLQTLVLLYPEIETMDINPFFIDETDVWAIDVKMNICS